MKFSLGSRTVSAESPVYLIAETGTTANGSVETAKNLIDVVKEAGFDAIKFQNISPKDYMSDRTVLYKFQTAAGPREENMFEMLQTLTFSETAWKEIMGYAKKRDLICFATVNWLGGIEIMESLNVSAYKIASWDLNYPDLQRRMFKTGKPVFIDLGPVDLLEVIKIRKLARDCGNDKIVFLYDFHTSDPQEMHMRAIPALAEKLDEFVGFSSPGKESELDFTALGLGAKVLEKRVTLDDKDPGHHHFVALTPSEATKWVQSMRKTESALGRRELIPSQADLNDKNKYFRGVTVLRPIRKGEELTPENLGAKRPMKGISPEHLDLLWGKVAAVDLSEDTQIDWNMVDMRT